MVAFVRRPRVDIGYFPIPGSFQQAGPTWNLCGTAWEIWGKHSQSVCVMEAVYIYLYLSIIVILLKLLIIKNCTVTTSFYIADSILACTENNNNNNEGYLYSPFVCSLHAQSVSPLWRIQVNGCRLYMLREPTFPIEAHLLLYTQSHSQLGGVKFMAIVFKPYVLRKFLPPSGHKPTMLGLTTKSHRQIIFPA